MNASPALKTATTGARPLLRRQMRQAEEARIQRIVRMISPDRAAVRQSLCVLALEPKREPMVLPAGYAFSANGANGSVELRTVRDEMVPVVSLEESEEIPAGRLLPERGELSGTRLRVSNPTAAPLSRLLFFVHDLDTLVRLLSRGDVAVRTVNGEVRSARIRASGIEHADVYPTPSLGSRARSLWTAYYHAPSALAFVEISFAQIADRRFEVLVLFANPMDARRVAPSAFQLNCVPVVNQRTLTVSVTVEPHHTFEPIPCPAGQTVAGIGKVQAFQGDGAWADCRPWLGTRYPWKHRRDAKPEYVLSPKDGKPWFAIGLAESQRGLDAKAIHLNVELLLADPAAGQLARGTAAVGDRGEQAMVASSASPLLVPLEVEPLELEAEVRSNGWLSRSHGGNVTQGLCAFLERAAGGVSSTSGRTPPPHSAITASAVRSAIVRSAPATGAYPLLSLDVELDNQSGEDSACRLFALVLERSLPWLAPPLTGTQLILHTPQGVHRCDPRWPVD